jgi:CBS domain-containing protein
MKSKDIMTGEVITVTPETTVETIAQLLTAHRIGGVPVIVSRDNRRVVGIVSESDLFLKERGIPFSAVKLPALFRMWVDPNRLAEIYEGARHHTASDVMTGDVVCVDVEEDIGRVA